MKLRSGRRTLRRKNIYLPTEVWVDIFCYPWITRTKMGRMVPKIGNRWFGEQLQFYLHEWGKHTLGKLYFTHQEVRKWLYELLEYPQTAMPENIKFCKSFEINHFDNQVFNFFRRIQSVLTADTKLDIRFEQEMENENDVAEQLGNARFILSHLLPLIDGVHAIKTDDQMLPIVQSIPPEKFHKVKVLDVKFTRFVQSAVEPILEWLTSSPGPKTLQLTSVSEKIDRQVLETICKRCF